MASFDSSAFEYDIQGQIVPKSEHQVTPVNANLLPRESDYREYAPSYEGSVNFIPATAPGSTENVPQIGQRYSGEVVDPLKRAVDANYAGMINLGQLSQTRADVLAQRKSEPVLAFAPTINK